MSHYFEIFQNRAGEYVARFKYNSETIFVSEGYSSKASALSAIDAVKRSLASPEIRDESHTAEPSIDELIDSTDWTGLGKKISQENAIKIRKKSESLLKAIIQSEQILKQKLTLVSVWKRLFCF